MSDPAKIAEYEDLKKQLQEAILRKKNLDKELQVLEEEIFHKEGIYLQDNTNGTILRGFDTLNKLNAASTNNASSSAANKKGKQQYSEEDRVFSLSSNTYVRHLQRANDGDDENADAMSISLEGTPNTSSSSIKKRRRDE